VSYARQAVDYAASSGNFYRRFETTFEDRKPQNRMIPAATMMKNVFARHSFSAAIIKILFFFKVMYIILSNGF
jgi:hypothetical protein